MTNTPPPNPPKMPKPDYGHMYRPHTFSSPRGRAKCWLTQTDDTTSIERYAQQQAERAEDWKRREIEAVEHGIVVMRERDTYIERAEKAEATATAYAEYIDRINAEKNALKERVRELEVQNGSLTEVVSKLHLSLSALENAVHPTAETKRAYMGEFKFNGPEYTDENGQPRFDTHMVPWTTIKEIMAAIRGYAALTPTSQDSEGKDEE